MLDGQQRITSLYGIIKGKEPPFFEGNAAAFTNLYFNVEDEVFELAKEKLIAYAKTDQYVKSVEESAAKISEKLTADDVIIKISEKDLKLKEQIIKAFGNTRKCEIQVSEDIVIGGITGQSRELGLLIDETLDTKLDEQHEWFCENSGLKVTE